MKFDVMEHIYNNNGTTKAFADYDSFGNFYYIPRSQIKIIDRIEPKTEFGATHLIIEVPDWIIHNNDIPVFQMTALNVIR